jgi:ankyrin repeat protein
LLHYAVSRDLRPLFDRLIAHGVDVNAATEDGETPLAWAARGGKNEMIEILLAKGADLEAAGGAPMVDAAFRGHQETIQLLVDRGASVNTPDVHGRTPLMSCVRTGNVELGEFILKKGADVNHRGFRGQTALFGAAQQGQAQLVASLLTAGARPDIPDSTYSRTPLHLAAVSGYADIATLLMDAGGAIDRQDGRGNTPLELASRHGHTQVAEVLVARGAERRDSRTESCALADQPALADEEAVIWYLNHSGWAVLTKNHLLVFDYFSPNRAADEPGLCNGHIHPQEIAGRDVIVFATHVHADHYDPAIFEWRETVPDITYVLGFQPEEEVPAHEYVGPRDARKINGVEIATIESNDSGVGFVVEADGLVILHPGDHANQMGVHYALETLHPKVFFPMHAGGGGEFRYHEFVDDCRDQFPKTRMEAAWDRGDRFLYRDGRISYTMLAK